MIKQKLSVRDLFILERFDGREVNYKIPEYELEEFGYNYAESLTCLIKGGYLTYAEPKIALNVLTVPQLKEILRSNGKKLSGKKDDLITRIIETCAGYEVPKVYAATEKGINELETRDYFFENKREGYGFLDYEVECTELEVNPECVLRVLFNRALEKHTTANNYFSLACVYENYGRYYKHRNQQPDELQALLTAAYLQLTGMGDGNDINDYKDLGYVFSSPLWSEIDRLKTALNLSDEELTSRIESAAATVKVPFSYFEPKVVAKIILDRLRGEENLLAKYESRRQIEKRNSISTAQASSGSGCLVVVLMLIILVVGGCMSTNHNFATPEEFVRDFKAASLNASTLQKLQQVTGDVFIRTAGDMEAVLIVIRPRNGEVDASAVQDALAAYEAAIKASDSSMTDNDVKKIFAGLDLNEPPDLWQKDKTVEHGGHRYIVSELSGGEKVLSIMKE